MRWQRPLTAAALTLAVALIALAAVQAPASASSSVPRPIGQSPQGTAAAPPRPPDLASLLAKTAEYCGKLDNAAFDFVCLEEIRETIDPKLDRAEKDAPLDSSTREFLGPTVIIHTMRKIKHSFLYDYQCVRAGRTFRETRTQLEENGKPKNVPNAALDTSIVVFRAALLGPLGIFDEHVQKNFDYRIAGREKIGETSAVVIDAKPKPGAQPTRSLFGKAWVDPATGDILRIEWSESRVGNFDVFARRGERFKRTPRLTIRSEFTVEKNGLRFPSRLAVEEAYLKDSGKAFVRSRTDVVYRNFKFFTVEVEH